MNSFIDKLNSVVKSPEEVQASAQTVQEYKEKYQITLLANEFYQIIKERMEQKAKSGEYSLIDNMKRIYVEVNSQEVFNQNGHTESWNILSSVCFYTSEIVMKKEAWGIFQAKGEKLISKKYYPTEFSDDIGNAVKTICMKDNIQCEVKFYVIDPITQKPEYKDLKAFTYTGKWGWYCDPYIGLGITATITF